MLDPYVIPGVSDGDAHTRFLTAGRFPTETVIRATRDHDIPFLVLVGKEHEHDFFTAALEQAENAEGTRVGCFPWVKTSARLIPE